MPSCSQCDTPAFVQRGKVPLCIRHELMLEQSEWIRFAMSAAYQNVLYQEAARGSGLPPISIQIPPPPILGDELTLNNIKITNSAVGLVNTGTIKHIEHIDASVTTLGATGKDKLAEALRDFTQQLMDNDIEPNLRDEITEQIEYLAAQAQAEPRQRSLAICKWLLHGIRQTVQTIPQLVPAWLNLQKLFEQYLSP